jgi:hypothetical protein
MFSVGVLAGRALCARVDLVDLGKLRAFARTVALGIRERRLLLGSEIATVWRL